MKMAATGSARSTSRLGQKCKARPADMLKTRTHSQLLTLDEARCPVCSEILLEPVTMPCSHSVCLHCFKRTVEFTSLCCPLCRLRVSSWARKQSREKSLVNIELWEIVRKSYPQRCKRRMEQRDCETGGEEIFRSPAQVSKSGEIRLEYGKQQVKVPMNEENDEGRRKVLHHRKEECGTLKHFQDPFYGLLSDSENEEPIGKRTRNVSAFVRRTKISADFTRDGLQTNVVQRSQSCTDTEEGRQKIRVATHLPGLDKASIAHSYSAGILLSSENSRSLSAPIIVQDKRRSWRGVIMAPSTPFMVPQLKQERSISPESNDSISEELNHFKPIVCSPCTPPKRLPDGRVMEPTIVKSTPRNLFRSLQRPTSYEASPTILQKWKQIEVDRQSVKVTSKGTLTSPMNSPMFEDLVFKPSPIEEKDSKPCSCTLAANKGKEHLGRCAKTACSEQENERTCIHNKQRLIFDQAIGETALHQKQFTKFHTPFVPLTSEETVTECGVSSESMVVPESHCGPTSIHQNPTLVPHNINASVRGCKLKSKDSQDQRKELGNRNCAQNQPTSRRGKKRSQKTKHLEETESGLKRPRSQSQYGFNIECAQADLYIQQVQQEREDRELALNLQRQFDREQQQVDKQKTSLDKYFLRSCNENRIECNPRRSGRISKRNEHFNCNY
ncbi:E3 ubiquitin-protein ligase RNF169 [Coregonus clupeaformis]|uniref:E3 ubiquitin-protein ligase RNF169 n=1 Tax=Coregonus clupeaformis TaxID=59861 RepID=UPI001E1C2B63|nr:E3 ubiquitin-protein ligase RNF169 [Coregonus clupeaformis]